MIRLDGADSIPKQRWVENSVESIESIESTRLVGLVVESSYRKSIYRSSESIRPRLIAIRLDGTDSIPKQRWVENSVESIDSIESHDSSALLSNRHTGSRFIVQVSRFVRG